MLPVRIIARKTLRTFAETHPDSAAALGHWEVVAKGAAWSTIDEVQRAFSKAKALDGERVRFDLAGGEFRLIVAFDFGRQIVFIKFVGAHADYDRIDALTVSLF